MIRQRTTELGISTFSFLSVLCAVIGILMLMMVAIIGTRAFRSEPVAGPDGSAAGEAEAIAVDAQTYQSLEKELLDLSTRVLAIRDRTVQAQQRLRELERMLESEEARRLAAAPPGRRTGARLAAKQPVAIVPDHRAPSGEQPVRIEVTAAGFTVYPDRWSSTVAEIAQSESRASAFFRGFQRTGSRKYPLFLIQPNGVGVYHRILAALGKLPDGPDSLGFEPFSEEWVLAEQGDVANSDERAKPH